MKKRTRVGIIGAGPAGLLLAHLLWREGIDCVIVENRSRDYVEARIRAGLLEQGSVDLLHETGVGERLAREGLTHEGILLRFGGVNRRLDIKALTGRAVTIYGQHEVVKDLIAARIANGGEIMFECEGVSVHDLAGKSPTIRCRHNGEDVEIACDLIAGCDGFHGICRPAIPDGVLTIYDHPYPQGWVGVLVDAPPVNHELIYTVHERGFALFTMRSNTVSRLYLQCRPDDVIENWSDNRIWDEFAARLGWSGRAGAEQGTDPAEGHHRDALVRVRAAAVRQPVPGRRRRPHRAADRRQGHEPGGSRRARAVARDERLFEIGQARRPGRLLAARPEADLARTAFLVVDDLPDPQLRQPRRVRAPRPALRAGVCRLDTGGRAGAGRDLRRHAMGVGRRVRLATGWTCRYKGCRHRA